jgi:hypothetical protein
MVEGVVTKFGMEIMLLEVPPKLYSFFMIITTNMMTKIKLVRREDDPLQ